MPRQNLSPERAPAGVLQVGRTIGANIAVARRRRRLTQAALAARAGITRVTLARVEAGHPGTGLGAYLAVLWALGLDRDVTGVANPGTDREGATLEAARLGRRVRPARRLDDDF